VRLIRTAIADIGIGNLKSGEYRYLQKKEVGTLIGSSGARDKKGPI